MNRERQLRHRYGYLAKDFVETTDRLLFAVIASGLHACQLAGNTYAKEETRIAGWLRYHRHPDRLTKLDAHAAMRVLLERQPDWSCHFAAQDAWLHGVPPQQVSRHWQPAGEFLGRLQRADGNHRTFQRLAAWLHPLLADVGVTGSHLIGAAGSGSDIDLVVYGLDNFYHARQLLCQACLRGELQQLDAQQWQTTYRRRGCELTFEEYLWHEQRKNNKFMHEGTKIDLSCCDVPHPVAMQPGRKLERAEIQGRVIDASHSFLDPAVYRIESPRVDYIVACTPTYAGQACEGEWIEAAGWLEQLADRTRRLVVGTSREAPGEFLRCQNSHRIGL